MFLQRTSRSNLDYRNVNLFGDDGNSIHGLRTSHQMSFLEPQLLPACSSHTICRRVSPDLVVGRSSSRQRDINAIFQPTLEYRAWISCDPYMGFPYYRK